MKHQRNLRKWLSVAVLALSLTGPLACGDAGTSDSPNLEDPGDPGWTYGPKASASLSIEGAEAGFVLYTAVCVNEPNRAHLYARHENNRTNEGAADYYISLVFDDDTWQQRDYSHALAGEVWFTMKDGRMFSGAAKDLDLKLTMTRLGSNATEYYLVAFLEVTVPSTVPGDAPLLVRSQINNPNAI
jgi:hypothetical protein